MTAPRPLIVRRRKWSRRAAHAASKRPPADATTVARSSPMRSRACTDSVSGRLPKSTWWCAVVALSRVGHTDGARSGTLRRATACHRACTRRSTGSRRGRKVRQCGSRRPGVPQQRRLLRADQHTLEGQMRALVINCSAPHYNLGARKLTDWLRAQGYDVTYGDGDPGLFAYGHDLVYLSVIFSWHAPLARAIALRVRRQADVWCGGPGMFALTHWWKRETGLDCQRGLDGRFERQRG